MKTYLKTFVCSDVFPTWKDDEWNVREGNKIAERWRVVSKHGKSFTVLITELIPQD